MRIVQRGAKVAIHIKTAIQIMHIFMAQIAHAAIFFLAGDKFGLIIWLIRQAFQIHAAVIDRHRKMRTGILFKFIARSINIGAQAAVIVMLDWLRLAEQLMKTLLDLAQ